jgi:hypothetical protein
MISPYVAHESRRLRLVKNGASLDVRSTHRPASPSREALEGEGEQRQRANVAGRPPAAVASESRRGLSIVSSKAEHRTGDYRFSRQRSDRLPLEKSPRLQSDGERLLRGLLCALSISAALALIALVA